MPDRQPGLLPIANRCSWVGLIAAPSLGIILFIANLAYYLGQPKGDLILRPLHSQIVVGLATLGVASVVVQGFVRAIRNQRRIMRLLEQVLDRGRGPEPNPGVGLAPEDIEGLTPEMVDIARRTSVRLRSAA